MADDNNDKHSKPPTPHPRGPTLNEVEQHRQAVALIDAIFDEAADAAAESDGPIDARGRRLAAAARRMVDNLPAHIAAAAHRGRVAGDRGAGPSDGRPCVVVDAATVATARILLMSRHQLEGLVSRLHDLRGDTPTHTFEGLTDDDLRELARQLRPQHG